MASRTTVLMTRPMMKKMMKTWDQGPTTVTTIPPKMMTTTVTTIPPKMITNKQTKKSITTMTTPWLRIEEEYRAYLVKSGYSADEFNNSSFNRAETFNAFNAYKHLKQQQQQQQVSL